MATSPPAAATANDTTNQQQANPADDLTSGAGFSLAELADIDVSDIEEVRFIAIPAGAYDFEVVTADLSEDEKDGERRFKVTFGLKIIDCLAVLEQGVDKDKLIGKTHEERFFINPSKPEDEVKASIGRIRAFITDMGGDSKGKLGPIVRNMQSHTFRGQIIKQKDRQDPTREYARLKLAPRV